MRPRKTLFAATVSTLGMVVCLACGQAEKTAASGSTEDGDDFLAVDEGSAGSALPCAVPLAWRITRVDKEFGVTMAAANEALRKAIADWETAAGRTLFALDDAGGSPIRFVFDERQQRSQERTRLQDEMRGIGGELDQRRTRLERETERATTAILHHEMQSRELQARVAEHNDLVRRWNERGGASPDVQRRVRVDGNALQQETQELQMERQRLEETRNRIDSARAQFDADVVDYNRLAADIDARYPPTKVESGVYREAIRTERGRVASASREIRVYRFSDQEDLVRVLAHELGHALGLGHVEVEGALMSAEYGPGQGRTTRRIKREDVNALIERCTGLFEG